MTAPITQAEAYAAEIRALKQDLSAKASDFDAALRKISALRDEVEDFQAACKSACEQRDELGARVTALQAAVDSKADWRPPAREITDPAELDTLAPFSVVLAYGIAHQAVPDEDVPVIWLKPAGQRSYTSTELLAVCRGAGVTVLYLPEEEANDADQ